MKRAMSLFSGAGGDTIGLTLAGYKVIAFSENNKEAIITHKTNYPDSELLSHNGDTNIKNIPNSVFEKYSGTIDVLFAGFPCQGFSHAGKKNINDPRSELVYEFVRVASIVNPTWIVGENVKGLLSRQGYYKNEKMPVIEIIKILFEDIGYKINWKVLSALNHGLPQKRERLIIVGHKSGYPNPFENLISVKQPTLRDILLPTLRGAVEYTPVEDAPDNFWIQTVEKECLGTPHPNLVRLASGIRNLSSKEKGSNQTNRSIVVEGGLISFGKRAGSYHGEVLNPDGYCKTIICSYAVCPRLFVGLRNDDKYYLRTLLPEELALIQGFPKDYRFIGNEKTIIKQIGNAVPPNIIKDVVESLEKGELLPEKKENTSTYEEETEDDD